MLLIAVFSLSVMPQSPILTFLKSQFLNSFIVFTVFSVTDFFCGLYHSLPSARFRFTLLLFSA